MGILDNFSLEGKVALVTGASYGIGFAIATAFAEAGATIVFNDIRQELVDKGLASYEEKGIKAHGYVCDVTNEEQVEAMVAQIEKEVGTIDILVNNAGIIKRIPMLEMKASEFRQVIDVDLNAPFIVSKAVIPGMIKKGHGKIINISSMWGTVGASCEAAYSATKSGMNGLTKALAKELAPSNVQVNAIACGVIDTAMNAQFSEEEREALREEIPAGRFADSEEVAALALTLASGHSYLTGQIIGLDGGYI